MTEGSNDVGVNERVKNKRRGAHNSYCLRALSSAIRDFGTIRALFDQRTKGERENKEFVDNNLLLLDRYTYLTGRVT